MRVIQSVRTFALQLVHHGDVVERDDGEHCLGAGQTQTLLQDGGDVAGDQLLREALVVGDEHDDDEQPVPHRRHATAQRRACQRGEHTALTVFADPKVTHPFVFSMRSMAAGMASSRPLEPSGVAEPMLAKISSIIWVPDSESGGLLPTLRRSCLLAPVMTFRV